MSLPPLVFLTDSLHQLIVPNMDLDVLRSKVGEMCYDHLPEGQEDNPDSIPDDIWLQRGTTKKDVLNLARIFIFQSMQDVYQTKDNPGQKARFVYLMDIFLSNDLNTMMCPEPLEDLADPAIFPEYEHTFTRALVHFYRGSRPETPGKQPSIIASKDGIKIADILLHIDSPPLGELLSNTITVVNWIYSEGGRMPNIISYGIVIEKIFTRIQSAGGTVFIRNSEDSDMRILEGAELVQFLKDCSFMKFQVTLKDSTSLCVTLIPQ